MIHVFVLNNNSIISAVIRECFSTSILLGSLDSPVQAKDQCLPELVESDAITACICTTDLCNDLASSSDTRPQQQQTTTLSPRLITQAPRNDRTFSPKRDPFSQLTTERFKSSAVTSVPFTRDNDLSSVTAGDRVLCYKCGSLFSSDGNADCTEFDDTDPNQKGFCKADEVCLMYTWQKSR